MEPRRRRHLSGAAAAIIILLILLLLAGVVVGVFRIQRLEVVGNQRTSSDQIRQDLIYDFKSRNTLYFCWKYKTAGTDSRAPYLSSIKAKFVSPRTVQLQVQEKQLIGCIQYSGLYYYFDRTGLVLDSPETRYDTIPLVTGVSMEKPEMYQKLPIGNAALLNTVLSISQLMLDSALEPESIAFDENQSISLQIGTVKVELGQDEYLEEKVANLGTIYEQVKNQQGTLNMTAFTGKNETITFSRDDEPEPSEQPAGQEGDNSGAGPSDSTVFMAFDSYGNLHYDAHVVNGQVVDGNGDPIEGCYVNEDGNAVDAYWNVTELNLDMGQSGSGTDTGEDASSGGNTEETQAAGETYGLSAFMVFDSYGTLRYDAHVVNGQVVDASGNPIPGCSVNADGYVVDAYWNVIDPMTGTLAQ